jgi:Zn-finger nucleic acid-binding protein
MSNHKYMGPGNIIIDTCNDCDLIWLDFGELSKVVAAPGSDRGEWRTGPNELHSKSTQPAKQEEREDRSFGRALLTVIEDFLQNR